MNTSDGILARMTPEMVVNELESIAKQIRDGQEMEQWTNTELRDMHTSVDVLHLRQIADWIEARYNVSTTTLDFETTTQADGQEVIIAHLESTALVIRDGRQPSALVSPFLRHIADWMAQERV
jgi:hypothetical protein